MAVGGVPQFGLLESGIMPRMDRLEGLGLAGHLSLSQFDSLCLSRAGASSQRAILREAGCPPYSGLPGKQEEGRATKDGAVDGRGAGAPFNRGILKILL